MNVRFRCVLKLWLRLLPAFGVAALTAVLTARLYGISPEAVHWIVAPSLVVVVTFFSLVFFRAAAEQVHRLGPADYGRLARHAVLITFLNLAVAIVTLALVYAAVLGLVFAGRIAPGAVPRLEDFFWALLDPHEAIALLGPGAGPLAVAMGLAWLGLMALWAVAMLVPFVEVAAADGRESMDLDFLRGFGAGFAHLGRDVALGAGLVGASWAVLMPDDALDYHRWFSGELLPLWPRLVAVLAIVGLVASALALEAARVHRQRGLVTRVRRGQVLRRIDRANDPARLWRERQARLRGEGAAGGSEPVVQE